MIFCGRRRLSSSSMAAPPTPAAPSSFPYPGVVWIRCTGIVDQLPQSIVQELLHLLRWFARGDPVQTLQLPIDHLPLMVRQQVVAAAGRQHISGLEALRTPPLTGDVRVVRNLERPQPGRTRLGRELRRPPGPLVRGDASCVFVAAPVHGSPIASDATRPVRADLLLTALTILNLCLLREELIRIEVLLVVLIVALVGLPEVGGGLLLIDHLLLHTVQLASIRFRLIVGTTTINLRLLVVVPRAVERLPSFTGQQRPLTLPVHIAFPAAIVLLIAVHQLQICRCASSPSPCGSATPAARPSPAKKLTRFLRSSRSFSTHFALYLKNASTLTIQLAQMHAS
uniref:Uncharacterized protein n=1 Tax=Anopheles atroparvus TaxID=41427 RepID=A0A182IJQ2_ANOAO